jgi:membrane-bound lytic murein transglycosylase B
MDSIKTIVTMVPVFLTFCVSEVSALSESDFQMFGNKYGISPHLLQAVSAVESQKGEVMGKFEIRKVVDKTQLKYLKKIARHTGRSLSEFKGSYAGAMGYMQIMPATFYEYAQDGDGDGVRDPLNPYDSLATAAYYLARNIAKKGNIRAALRRYNNSAAYCESVVALYRQLELESQVAASE